MNVIDILVKEHKLIQRFLDNLTVALGKVVMGDSLSNDYFKISMIFIKDFIGEFHHFKEEDVLFVQLAQRNGGILDGSIGSLRQEHEHCRNFVTEVSNSLDGYSLGSDIYRRILFENMRSYISLLTHHIRREDEIFQMALKEIPSAELKGMLTLFIQEDQKTDGKMFENSQLLVEEMESLSQTYLKTLCLNELPLTDAPQLWR